MQYALQITVFACISTFAITIAQSRDALWMVRSFLGFVCITRRDNTVVRAQRLFKKTLGFIYSKPRHIIVWPLTETNFDTAHDTKHILWALQPTLLMRRGSIASPILLNTCGLQV
jgi:hypothetical protein